MYLCRTAESADSPASGKSFIAKTAGVLGMLLSLSGCGTQVPRLTEFWGDADSSHLAIIAVVNQLQCELKNAVHSLDDNLSRVISSWLVQANLTLTVDERTELNPGLTLTTPFAPSITRFSSGNVTVNPNFSFGLGAALSAQTTRILKLNFLYRISEVMSLERARDESVSVCAERIPSGYLLTQSDLRIGEALRAGLASTAATALGTIPPAAIVHQVTFQIRTSGGLTPSWRLVRVSANTSATTQLFGAARNRTQDVTFTFGPPASAPQPASQLLAQPTLAPAAQNAALAAEIGSAVAASIQARP